MEAFMPDAATKESESPSHDLTRKEPTTSTTTVRKADDTTAPDVDRGAEGLRMNRIARRAHQIYEARGGQHGKALEDWLQAEREIDAESPGEGPTER
jgi:hypothetical protein